MLIAGELEGKRDHVTERWKVAQHVIRARREERRSLETARPVAQAQVPRACAGKGGGMPAPRLREGTPGQQEIGADQLSDTQTYVS